MTGVSDDATGVSGVTFRYCDSTSAACGPASGSSLAATDDGGGAWSASLDTTALADGHTYTWVAVATDNAGNAATAAARTLSVDNSAPTLATVAPTLDTPAIEYWNGAASTLWLNNTGSGSFELNATASDPDSGVAKVSFPALLGTAAHDLTTPSAAPDRYTSNTYSFTDQSADISPVTVSATNAATVGDGTATTSASLSLKVDGSGPSLTLDPSLDGSYVQSGVVIGATSSDAGSGVQQVSFAYCDRTADAACVPNLSLGSVTTPTSGTYSLAWDNSALPDGQYALAATASDNVGNSTTSSVATVNVDNHAPTVTITAPGAYVNAADPATVSFSATTPDTDVASVQFSECSDGSAGCATGTWQPIGAADTSAPWTTSWTPAADGTDVLRALATDNAGHTGSDVVTVTVDRTAPSGVTVGYADGYASGTVAITTGNGPDSDVDPASALLERRVGTLAGDACSAWGAWTAIAGSPDNPPAASCAQYRYTVSDDAGNPATATSANTVKVDTTAPTGVTLSFGGFTNAAASGTTVYFRPGASGGFTVTASGSDAESGIASTAYPPLGSGWTGAGTYSFDNTAGAPSGSQTVTLLNGAGLGTGTSFDVVPDATGPSGGSVDYVDGWNSDTAYITLDAGTDTGSGIATRTLERAETTLTGGACDLPLGAFSAIATDPSTPYTDAGLASNHCYAYRYVVTDAVGNARAYTSLAVIKVDTTVPTGTLTDPGTDLRGTISLSASASDTGSGISQVDFQMAPTGTSSWQTLATDTTAPYTASFDSTSPQLDGDFDFRAVVTDGAGNVYSTSALGPRTIDNTPPDTTIDSKPAAVDNSSTPAFAFSSSEAGSTFECSVDGAVFSACGSPLTLPTLGEGAHTFAVRATDLAGNTDPSPATWSWTVDTVPPSAGMSDPGSYLRGTVALASTSTDVGGSGVASVTFEVSVAGSGGPWTPISTLPWDTKTGADSVADGLYDLHVVATDQAGNVATSAPVSNVRVDNTAPAVSVTAPAAGSAVTGTTTLTASTTDADPAPTVVFEAAPHGTTTWQTVPATWNTKTGADAVADGSYDVRATATDWAGNTTVSATISNVIVDNQAPTVAVTAPADGGYVNAAAADPFALTASATDAGTGVAQVDFYECTDATCSGARTHVGADTTGSGGTYSVSWPVPADGGTWIEAVATDQVGHSSSSIVAVTVDRTLPDTTILTKPGDPTNDAFPGFSFAANEATQGYECRLDGGAWTSCATPYALGSTPADGSHTLDVRAVDLAGNADASPASWTWLEDRTAPTASLADPAAANAAHAVRGTVALSSTTGDPGPNASGVDTVTYEYSADGITWAPTPQLWATDGISDGVYQLHVVVTDFAGNSTTSTTVASVKVDNTPPVTSQDDPGQYLRSTITLTGTAGDPDDPQGVAGSGVEHVEFQVSPAGAGTWTTVGSTTTAPYSASFDTTSLADGRYDFRTLAFDVAGNQAVSTPVTNRLVDNTKPVVALNDPGTNLHGTVQLSTNPAGTTDPGADPSGIVSTAYEISPAGANTWSAVAATWNTTGVADGVYDIRALVTDAAGNVSDPSVVGSKRVDNTAPTTAASGVPSGFSSSDVTVTLSASDSGSGVSDTLYQVDGGTVQHGTSVVIAAPADGSNDGSHTITFQSVDAAGNVETQQSVTVQIDATPPACASCSASDYLHGTVTLSATPSDSGAGITSVAFQYSADGTTWTTIGTDATGSAGAYSTSWATSAAGDGAYHLQAVITDGAANVTPVDLHPGGAGVVVIDNTAPSASVGAPTAGAVVGGTVTISASASDANPLTYAFLVNGSQVASGASPSTSWSSTSVSDGPAQVQVRATDPAGNSTLSAAVTVTVDNQSPAPSLSDPGSAISGTPTLSVSTDADTQTVEYQRRPQGGSTWTSIGTAGAPFTQPFATGAVADGTYELRAIATDQAGHTGTSGTRTVVIDNTVPSGAITLPLPGKTIGGPATPIVASVSDSGSGIASVEFDWAPNGTNSWMPIATVNAAPYQITWDATTVATGQYDLRLVVTDNAGNVDTTSPTPVHVDSTAPTVVLDDPGIGLSGTATLTATTSGAVATKVEFQVSPAGANAWQTLATDTASPWSATVNTASLADGLYDIRAVASDALGNQATSSKPGVLIDNTAPSVVSSAPADGSVLSSASSVTLDASEAVTYTGVTLDGGATVAPTLSGSHAVFATGALNEGPHTLSGTLVDATSKTRRFLVHFTVYSGSGPAPYVEKNTSQTQATTVTAAAGGASVTMPAGAWSGDPSDWLVLRVQPQDAAAVAAAPLPISGVVDVSAHWAIEGDQVHQFAQPLDVTIPGSGSGTVAATYDGTSWRILSQLSGTTLPADRSDGFYRSGGTIHVLTRHLSLFGLLTDAERPSPVRDLNGSVHDGNLYLYWAPGSDNSGVLADFVVFVDGQPVMNLGATEYQYEVGPWDPSHSHTYGVVEVDGAGNTSDQLQMTAVPTLAGLTLEEARAALAGAGFVAGDATVVVSDLPAGTVAGPTDLVLAAPGSTIPLQLSAGPGAEPTKFTFSVVSGRNLPLATRAYIGVRIAATRQTTIVARLLNGKGKIVKTWRVKARAGASVVKLALPKGLRKPGAYTLKWSAASSGEVVRRTMRVTIVRKLTPGRASPSGVDVVVAGSKLPKLPIAASKNVVRVLPGSDQSSFDIAADPARNVQVIVVDADEYGLELVRNLRTVFPNLKLVVLTSNSKTLAAAVRAGATVALPKGISSSKLASLVARLASGQKAKPGKPAGTTPGSRRHVTR